MIEPAAGSLSDDSSSRWALQSWCSCTKDTSAASSLNSVICWCVYSVHPVRGWVWLGLRTNLGQSPCVKKCKSSLSGSDLPGVRYTISIQQPMVCQSRSDMTLLKPSSFSLHALSSRGFWWCEAQLIDVVWKYPKMCAHCHHSSVKSQQILSLTHSWPTESWSNDTVFELHNWAHPSTIKASSGVALSNDKYLMFIKITHFLCQCSGLQNIKSAGWEFDIVN